MRFFIMPCEQPPNMTRLLVKQPHSYTVPLVMTVISGVFAWSALPVFHAPAKDLAVAASPLILGLLMAWAVAVAGRRTVEINDRDIVVNSVTIFFQPRSITCDATQFGKVVSYVTPGRNPVNRVELITKPGGEALLLCTFAPLTAASSSFLSLPTPGEAEAAAALRPRVAHACGVKDGGFLGYRMVGAQLGGTGS